MNILEKENSVYYKQAGSDKIPYIQFGRGRVRVWVSHRLIKNDKITFPVRDTYIARTEKGNFVMRPGNGTVVFNILVPCGYRGTSSFKLLSPASDVINYALYSSPRGSLGVSAGALIVAPDAQLVVRWERTGRLYGAAGEGVSILYPDGREESFDDIADVSDISELKKLVE